MATKYNIGKGKEPVLCQSLTFGYMYDIEKGIVEEEVLTAVMDGTGLTEEAVRELTRVQVNDIWTLVKKETYPELYDEDGNEKSFDEDVEDDKKKA